MKTPELSLALAVSDSAIALASRIESEINYALIRASAIEQVTNDDESEVACSVLGTLNGIKSDIEKARKAVKEPFLDMGRKIDAAAAAANARFSDEQKRIKQLADDWEDEKAEKRRQEELARARELDRIERERQEALRKAAIDAEQLKQLRLMEVKASHKTADTTAKIEADEAVINKTELEFQEQAKRAEELANQQREALGPPPEVTRAHGQVVRMEWQIESIDIWAVVKARPDLCNVEVKMRELKESLNNGPVPGVKATKRASTSVRAQKAIDV